MTTFNFICFFSSIHSIPSKVNHTYVQLDCCMPKSCSCKLLVAEFHAAGSFRCVLEISPNLANAGHGGSFADSSMQHPFKANLL